MSNLLIVEGKSDKIFFEALISELNSDIDVEKPIFIDDLEGSDTKKITDALKALEADIQKKDIRKIGIILDVDNSNEAEKLNELNSIIRPIFNKDNLFSKTCKLEEVVIKNDITVQLACYFTNNGGKGELETLLKKIISRESPHANCLSAWRDCVENKKLSITQKEFDKFWISIYLRYDTCSKKEKNKLETSVAWADLTT